MKVTIDRISGSGNPIAKAEDGDQQIHVPEGDVNEQCEIELYDVAGLSYTVGLKKCLSDEKKEEYRTHYKKAVKTNRKKATRIRAKCKGKMEKDRKKKNMRKKTKRVTEKHSNNWVKERKTKKEKKEKKEDKNRENKNHLLNGKL